MKKIKILEYKWYSNTKRNDIIKLNGREKTQKRIIYLVISIISLLCLTGCTNSQENSSELDNKITKEEEKKYSEFFDNLDKNKSSIKIEDNVVYLDYGWNTFEYYISEANEEYIYFYSGNNDFLIAYNITKEFMISFNGETNEYCKLEQNENTVVGNIKCENDSENAEQLSMNQTNSVLLLHFFKDFLVENKITKEELATILKVYYYKNYNN